MTPQPVGEVQWLPRDALRANDYNPNHVPPPELALLRESLLQDGWTQPIVARRDGEIVDGYHRWLVSADPDVAALTGGLVPVVYLRAGLTEAEQVAATIRHNRARGEHGVLRMADIVRRLVDTGQVTRDGLEQMLGMEPEEVERLYDRGAMVKRGAGDTFGEGWVPK